jgi:uncharacterized membrane-anchored protein
VNGSTNAPGLLHLRRVPESGWLRILGSKAPEVTLPFWVAKLLSMTVGVTAAGYLARDLGLGLAATTATVSLLCSIALIAQFSLRQHVPAAYWLSVVLLSVLGVLLADDLAEGLGIGRPTTAAVLVLGLATTFAAWYASEHTLSVHTVVTRRREAYYWIAVLLTFALGSLPALDTVSSLAVFGAVLGAIAIAWRCGLNAIVTFWAAYVVTCPFGASLGHVLAARLGTDVTTAVFLAVILAVVAGFSVDSGRRAHAGATTGC